MEVGHKIIWWRAGWMNVKIKMSFCCVIYQFDSEFYIFYNMYNGRIVRSPRETVGLFDLLFFFTWRVLPPALHVLFVERWRRIIEGISFFLEKFIHKKGGVYYV